MKTENRNARMKEYCMLTFSTLLIVIGVYYFKFPNNFSFGGVTGLAIVVSAVLPISVAQVNFIINMLLLLVGFLFLGKSFGIKTVYVTILTSVGLSLMELIHPLTGPLTDQPLLEMMFAILLPGFGSAILFNMGASSGGTDIIAMILKKYTSYNIGTVLMAVDCVIAVSAFFVFGPVTGLFSLLGLLGKSLIIDSVIESMNLCKYFTVVCTNPQPISEFIIYDLKRSATIFRAEGAYSHREKTIIMTVLRRGQALQLRNYIKRVEPAAFVMISNTSEIIGRGFTSV